MTPEDEEFSLLPSLHPHVQRDTRVINYCFELIVDYNPRQLKLSENVAWSDNVTLRAVKLALVLHAIYFPCNKLTLGGTELQ